MNKWIELILGLLLLNGAIMAWFFTGFGEAAWLFFKGGLVWFVIMIGLLFIMLGISDLKD